MPSQAIIEHAADKIRNGPDLGKLPKTHQAAFKARLKWLAGAGNHQIPPKGDW